MQHAGVPSVLGWVRVVEPLLQVYAVGFIPVGRVEVLPDQHSENETHDRHAPHNAGDETDLRHRQRIASLERRAPEGRHLDEDAGWRS